MKKVVFILALAAITLQSCNSGQAKDKSSETSEASAPVQMVSEEKGTAGGSVLLTKEVFLNKVWDYQNSPQEWVYKGDKPALIDFYADWCGPCKIASPILEEISKEYAGDIYVYKIDTEKERELASVFGVSSIPAFLYIPQNGKPVMMSGIARSKEDTKKMFKDNISKYLLTSN
ncbi:thiol reductase thioredoxin [Mariniphaga sediminis]|jgi:thioredoxin|uniref:Thiol reductase thioredoxin n=1 Tax=Mariniphaga sediminis TaxID=1628158 RepID=A0A399CY61_9BACT|nr:thioredoxin domain-containing protein [Mariniphaga sediminis]RIH64146.1 thiol reductase thioredoxin [Mariniphaga sediminis]